MSRTETIPEQWAKNAETTIPANPVSGTTYRDPALSAAAILEAWPFNEIVDSKDLNQFLYLISGVLREVESGGILLWAPAIDYPVNGLSKGSDGVVYESIQTPNLGNDPVSEPTFWQAWQPGGGGSDNFSLYYNGFNIAGFHNTFAGDLNTIAGNSVLLCDSDLCTNHPDQGTANSNVFITTYTNIAKNFSSQMGIQMNGPIARMWTRGTTAVANVWTAWTEVITGESTISGSNANGYYKIYPDGLVEQWGTLVTGSSGTFTLIYPIAFNGPPDQLDLTGQDPDDTTNGDVYIRSLPSATSVDVRQKDDYDLIYWSAKRRA